MEGYRVEPAAMEDVVGFVNAWAPEALETAGTPPTDPRIAEGRRTHRIPGATEAEQERLATRLHEVFRGDTAVDRRSALNGLLDDVSLSPGVGAHGQEWRVANESDMGLAGLIAALWDHAASDMDLARLGTCAGERCIDAYHDATHAHTRRFCSLTCQNRAKVAAYRRRQRGT